MERSLARTALDVDAALVRVEQVIARSIECQEPLLQQMVAQLVSAGGKRMRPRVALLAFDACGGRDPELAIEAAAGMELIHTASLVHDDIIDQSPLRRGRPTLHVSYGIPHAIVAGDFLFTQGYALSARMPKDLIGVTANACVRLAEGQLMEQRLLAEEVDEEQYLTIVAKKTAEPIRACAQVGAALAGAPKDLANDIGLYGLELGIAFQIADDVLDITGDPAETGKTIGQDAKRGVLTLPVGLGREARAFRQMARTMDPAELRRTLQDAGAIDKARAVAAQYAARAKTRLARVPAGPAKDALLALADEVVERRK